MSSLYTTCCKTKSIFQILGYFFQDICTYCVFAGVGGAYETPFPWKCWKKNGWFEAAVAVVSLNVKQLDKLIPGYRNFDQSLQTDYIGISLYYSAVKYN